MTVMLNSRMFEYCKEKTFVFNKYFITCSSELCSMLKHTQLNQSEILHIAFTISSIYKNYFRWFYCQISCKWQPLKCHTCLASIALQCAELTHKPSFYLGGVGFAQSAVWLTLMPRDSGKHDDTNWMGKFVFEKINPGRA